MISFSLNRILIVSLFIFFVHSAIFAQVRLNLFAGPQISSAFYTVKEERQTVQLKPGFHLGMGAKIEFEGHLYFSPSVYYSLKGYKVTLNKAAAPPDAAAINNNVQVHTIETAFLLQYDFTKTPSHFFIKLGPSLDFQILGREKFERVDGTTISRNMKYGFGDYGRYAASGVIHAGYEMANSLFFYAFYEQGLSNLSNADVGPSIKHQVTGITIGKFLK